MGAPTGGDESQPWLVGVVTSMVILSVAFVVLRLVSRRVARRKLWWDDWTTLVSVCCNAIYVALIFEMHARNLGGPASDPGDDRAALLRLLVAAHIVYAWNMCLTKTSVLLMYHRTFRLWPAARAYLILLGGFVLAWAVTNTFLSVFTCVPLQKLSRPDIPGRCLNHVAVWIASAAATVASELAILLFPIPHVCGLNLSPVEKMSVVLLFAMGFFVVFTSAYHFSTLFSAGQGDPTLTLTPTVGWKEVEIAAGITAACLPLLGPLLGPLLPPRPAAAAAAAATTAGLGDADGHESATAAAAAGMMAFSGAEDGDGSWRAPERATKMLSADSRRASRAASLWSTAVGKRGTHEHLSNVDAWDWERNVDSLTRADELSMCQHEASAARVEDAEDVEVPEHGISVTTDFRRWSVKE